MSNIIKKDDNLLKIIGENGIDSTLSLFKKEIYLFSTRVAGTSHINNKEVFTDLTLNQKVVLRREDNEHDNKAVLVLLENNTKIGYLPQEDNVIFSRLMDAGKLLIGRIEALDKKGNWNIVDIKIYLIDF